MTRRPILPTAAATLVALSTLAPWVLGYSASHAAVAGHIAFAMAFGPIALLVDAFAAAAGVLAAAGLWLAVSPWVLGYAARGVAAWASEVLSGLALVALARSARPTVTLPADPPEGRP